MINNPLEPFLTSQGYVVLDGGLATELERRGADLRDPLWSARLLLEDPELIYQVHLDYYAAGADVATSASYQAGFAELARRGLNAHQAAQVMRLSVELACRARDDFWAAPENRRGRRRPLVAASVGPYGAVLANGAEYTGDYGLDMRGLVDFHAPRLRVLAESGADLLACETIPTLVEAEALLVALETVCPAMPVWMSFTCRDGVHLWHGETLAQAVTTAAASPQVVAVGINCTAPRWVESLLAAARGVTGKPLVVYPNSGESWDAAARTWIACGTTDFGRAALAWWDAGARLIGGCCRTTPDDIRAVRAALSTLQRPAG